MTAVTGRVVDPAGRGVPGVWVYPTGAGARVGGVHTDRDGGWRLDLPPGTWQVRRSGREPLDVHVGTEPIGTDTPAAPPRIDTTPPRPAGDRLLDGGRVPTRRRDTTREET